MFKSAPEATRRRRERGTRQPVDWKDSFQAYQLVIFFAAAAPAASGIGLVVRHETVWQTLLGLLLVAFAAVEVALFVRWWRKPIDPDVLARNYYQAHGIEPRPPGQKTPRG